MRIQFCGADRTVTGSCHLIEAAGVRVLLDCGLYQGARDEAKMLNALLPDHPSTMDAVILSHGHLDHCGKLPLLMKHGFTCPIYCTPATAEVARIVMADSAQIQEEDAEFLNSHRSNPGDPKIQPLYTRSDVNEVLKHFKRVPYGQKVTIKPCGGANIPKTPTTDDSGLSFTFFDAGHILGSAYVLLEFRERGEDKKLLFTADVGRYDTPILRDPQTIPRPVNWVITESTYGNKKHAPMDQIEPQFLDAVQFCIQHKSRLLIPSFAVGRTQTVLWYMQKFVAEKKIPQIPIFVDSPMGVEVSHVHSQFRENYDEQTNAMIGTKDLFGLSNVTFASSVQQSKQINSNRGPCVIIASSPTCEFGRILHHLTYSVVQVNDVVVFVGWIPPQTLGRRLQNGEKHVRILDRWYDVKCQIRTIHGLSAHADGDELLRFLKPTLTPQTSAFVVHGEEDQAECFAQRLVNAGVGAAMVPAMESSVVTSTEGLPVPTVENDAGEAKAVSDGD
jgi:metallo-beta-lactamase family protein